MIAFYLSLDPQGPSGASDVIACVFVAVIASWFPFLPCFSVLIGLALQLRAAIYFIHLVRSSYLQTLSEDSALGTHQWQFPSHTAFIN